MSDLSKSYRITFVIDPEPGEGIDETTLRVLLDALTVRDIAYLRRHPDAPMLYESGVVYQEEPPGAEDWQDIPTSLKLGWADCEDLAAWRAAELVVRHGVDARPDFTCDVRSDGSRLYHIFVRLPDGRTEDPSRELGMR